MKSHSFVGKNPGQPCAFVFVNDYDKIKHVCGRTWKDHSDHAECESCDYVGICDLYVDKNMLLCPSCRDKISQALMDSVQASADEHHEEIKALGIDSTIRYNGDFFNAHMTPIIEMKKIIDDDVTIVDKHFAFQEALSKRRNILKAVKYDAQQKEYDASLGLLAIDKTLREFGADLRKEIREQLRIEDTNYVPPAPKIVVKAKLKAKSPMEKLIETLALTKGISQTEARLMIESGMSEKKKEE